MRVTLFGTRGSLAAPGAETNRYGGNTSTVEVCANDGTLLVLDAGTGIRRLAKQISLATPRIDILLTCEPTAKTQQDKNGGNMENK